MFYPKIIISFLCLALIGNFTGCGGSGSPDNTPPEETPIKLTIKPLINKSFESAESINEWNINNQTSSSIDLTTSFTGSSSLYLSTPLQNSPYISATLIENIPVEKGKQYEISFAVKLTEGGFSNYWDFYVFIDNGSNVSSLLDFGFNGDTQPISMNWFKQKYYFTAVENESISLTLSSSANETWIDDVEFGEVLPTSLPLSGISFDFESDNSLDIFNLFPRQSIYLDTTTSYNGSQSLFMGKGSGSGPVTTEIIDGIPVEKNASYVVSMAVKLQGDQFPNYWDFAVEAYQGNNRVINEPNGINGLTQPIDMNWAVYTFTFTTVDNTPVKLSVESLTDNAWVDDVTIRKIN